MAVYRYTIDRRNDPQLYLDDIQSRESKVRSLVTVDDKSLIEYDEPRGDDVAEIMLYYMSDLHLDHKIFKCLGYNTSNEKVAEFVANVARTIRPDNSESYHHFNLFAGDTSFEPNVAAVFYDCINGMSGNPQGTFAVLGNHELWAKHPDQSVEDFAKDVSMKWPIHLLQNDVAFINWNDKGYWREKWSLLEPTICDRDRIMDMPLSDLRD